MITSGVVTVGTVATKIHNNFSMEGSLHVSNLDNTDTIFIGGPSVVVNSGHALPKSLSEDFMVPAGDSFYAVSSKTGHSVGFVFITP